MIDLRLDRGDALELNVQRALHFGADVLNRGDTFRQSARTRTAIIGVGAFANSGRLRRAMKCRQCNAAGGIFSKQQWLR